MERLILVLEVESIPVGLTFREWPLHCTLVHWFEHADSRRVADELAHIFHRTPPVRLEGSDEALFGARRNLPVNLVVPTEELISLHKAVVRKLSDIGAGFTAEQFLGEGYRPHVTVHGGRRLSPGQVQDSQAVYLVKSVSENPKERIVLKRFGLRG